jgi:uncharacterized metal-binding protein
VLKCVSACLAKAGVVADTHVLLSDHGVRKRKHADFDPDQAAAVYAHAVLPAAQALRLRTAPPDGAARPPLGRNPAAAAHRR